MEKKARSPANSIRNRDSRSRSMYVAETSFWSIGGKSAKLLNWPRCNLNSEVDYRKKRKVLRQEAELKRISGGQEYRTRDLCYGKTGNKTGVQLGLRNCCKTRWRECYALYQIPHCLYVLFAILFPPKFAGKGISWSPKRPQKQLTQRTKLVT